MAIDLDCGYPCARGSTDTRLPALSWKMACARHAPVEMPAPQPSHEGTLMSQIIDPSQTLARGTPQTLLIIDDVEID